MTDPVEEHRETLEKLAKTNLPLAEDARRLLADAEEGDGA